MNETATASELRRQIFSWQMFELLMDGKLCEAHVFVLCTTCEDVAVAWRQDTTVCAQCGSTVPDCLPRGMYSESN